MVELASDFMDRNTPILGMMYASSFLNLAYTSQFLSLVMFAFSHVRRQNFSMQSRRSEIIRGLKVLPEQIKQVLELDSEVLKLSKEIIPSKICSSHGTAWL
ncbi:hypothetical protein CEXT_334201 [Caerostris extrusa]|uniref:Uncharacterized protein n=1 Tax=Caerostris extrusa TaxID=172846 RepID=A0AAV4X6V8_CAEEX|nr:hypothetical protein CEXT_334201 [Caerostris extrusa]